MFAIIVLPPDVGSTITVAPPSTTNCVILNEFASTSESFFNKPFTAVTSIVVSSGAELESGIATGASFTGVTVISNVAWLETKPSLSLTVYKISAEPLKFSKGVKTTVPKAFTV